MVRIHKNILLSYLQSVKILAKTCNWFLSNWWILTPFSLNIARDPKWKISLWKLLLGKKPTTPKGEIKKPSHVISLLGVLGYRSIFCLTTGYKQWAIYKYYIKEYTTLFVFSAVELSLVWNITVTDKSLPDQESIAVSQNEKNSTCKKALQAS